LIPDTNHDPVERTDESVGVPHARRYCRLAKREPFLSAYEKAKLHYPGSRGHESSGTEGVDRTCGRTIGVRPKHAAEIIQSVGDLLCFREVFLPEAGHAPVVADGTVAVTEINRHLNLQVGPLSRVIWVEIKNTPADRCATQSWNCFDDHQKT
jgi:hypothetical protein